MKKPQPRQPNVAHILFEKHLAELKIPYCREFLMLEYRKFRWDFVIYPSGKVTPTWAVEIDGYHNGRHGAGWGSDNEKMNLAMVNGWRFLRFSTSEVKSGAAKSFIEKHLQNLLRQT